MSIHTRLLQTECLKVAIAYRSLERATVCVQLMAQDLSHHGPMGDSGRCAGA